jgi:hypothetical protein
MEVIAETSFASPLSTRLQNWFGEDLSGVRLFVFRDSDLHPNAARLKGISYARDVYIAESLLTAPPGVLTSVVVHELTHVLQKRRAVSGASRIRSVTQTEFERQAHKAAQCYVLGEKCPDISADPTDRPRAWGPAGHYYTVYAVSRFAGLSDLLADQLAFFSQMPDQVKDLDAIVAGESWVVAALLPPAHRKIVMKPEDRILGIAEGLHCLTGNRGSSETQLRHANLNAISSVNDPRRQFSFGIGLHAFGDSFAHRTGDDGAALMYPAPFGHLFGGTGFVEKYWKLGKDVDNLSDRSNLYREYCDAMLEVLRAKFVYSNPHFLRAGEKAKSELAKTQQEKFSALVGSVVAVHNESKQIAKLVGLYPDKKERYEPEKEDPMLWQDFLRKHPKRTSPWMKEQAQRLIDSWS